MVLPLAVGLSCHLTFDKSDPKDAVIVARLHCYEPERADAVWARLRPTAASWLMPRRPSGSLVIRAGWKVSPLTLDARWIP
jgi:hypothetical protein